MGKIFYSPFWFDSWAEVWSPNHCGPHIKGFSSKISSPALLPMLTMCVDARLLKWVPTCRGVSATCFYRRVCFNRRIAKLQLKKAYETESQLHKFFIPQVTTVRALTLLFLFGYSRQRLSNPFQPTFCLTSMLLTVVWTISGVEHSGYCRLSDSRDSSQ